MKPASGFGQELFDVLVSVVALTDFHQTGKMEFHPSFDLTRWNVVTTCFQTLRQFFGTAEHAPRLATMKLYFATSDVGAAHKELSAKGAKVNEVKDDLSAQGQA